MELALSLQRESKKITGERNLQGCIDFACQDVKSHCVGVLSVNNPAANKTATHAALSKARLSGLDAVRGFDMFWLIGGELLSAALFAWTRWSV